LLEKGDKLIEIFLGIFNCRQINFLIEGRQFSHPVKIPKEVSTFSKMERLSGEDIRSVLGYGYDIIHLCECLVRFLQQILLH
jgi:hypothetical protein